MPFGISFRSPGPPPPVPQLPAELVAQIDLPAPGSTQSKVKQPPLEDAARTEQLEVSRAFEAARTPEGDTWAAYMADVGGTTLWMDEAKAMRAELGTIAGVKATAAVAAAMGEALLRAFVVGPKWERDRPYEMDPALTTVGGRSGTSSYPSGHAVQAYAAATVIAAAAPERADRVYDLAAQNAVSRVYAGVHLPSDVEAGARLGLAIGQSIAHRFGLDRIIHDGVMTGATSP